MRTWAFVLLVGCSIDDNVARVPTDAGPPPACPRTEGAALMADLGTHCIDTTEVTRAQYAKFVAAALDPSGQPSECLWNKAFKPQVDVAAPHVCTDELVDPVKNPDHPVICVDWCDAVAYCKWAGKRLCGKIGGGGDSFEDMAVHDNAATSQWFAGCGISAYPYGPTYEPERCCDLADGGTKQAHGVGQLAGCHGPPGTPLGGVFDMSGNVAEWTDACEGSGFPGDQKCLTRGGYFGDRDADSATLRCAFGASLTSNRAKPRNSFDDHIGIRCCADKR